MWVFLEMANAAVLDSGDIMGFFRVFVDWEGN